MAEEKKGFEPIYYLYDNMDQVIDEKGTQFISLRLIQWAKSKETEKSRDKAHYELRRWRMDSENGEVPGKGVTFFSEQGVHNCVTGLIDAGFGDTRECLIKLSEREDFRESVEHMYDDNDTSDSNGEFFDARELLLNE